MGPDGIRADGGARRTAPRPLVAAWPRAEAASLDRVDLDTAAPRTGEMLGAAAQRAWRRLTGTGTDARTELRRTLETSLQQAGQAEALCEHVERALRPGDDFAEAGRLLTDLIADGSQDGYVDTQGLERAWDHARGPLHHDPASLALFRRVLQHEREETRDLMVGMPSAKVYDRVVDAHAALRPPVRGESEAQRVDAYLTLSERFGFRYQDRALEAWNAVVGGLLPGETLEEAVDQLLAFHETLLERHAGVDTIAAFADVKAREPANPDEPALFLRLLDGLGSHARLQEARDALDLPLGDASLAEREAVLLDLAAAEREAGRDAGGAAALYRALATRRPPAEPLEEGVARMKSLIRAVRGEHAATDACAAFGAVSDSLQRPGSTRTPWEATSVVVASLLLDGDVERARARLLADARPPGTVDRESGWVIIGGIRVPVQETAS